MIEEARYYIRWRRETLNMPGRFVDIRSDEGDLRLRNSLINAGYYWVPREEALQIKEQLRI